MPPRRRNGDTAKTTTKRKRRSCPPPPPPPPSLVRLLKKDPQVLDYFQALQANLEADVQVWKDRAKDWEQQAKALQKEAASVKKKQNGQQRQQQASSSDNDSPSDNGKKPRATGKKRKVASQSKNSPPKMKPPPPFKKKNDDSLLSSEEEKINDSDEKEDGKSQVDSKKNRESSENQNRTINAASSSSIDQTRAVFDLESEEDNDDEEGSLGVRELLNPPGNGEMEITDDMLSYPSDSSDGENNDKSEPAKKAPKTAPLHEDECDDDEDDDDDGLSLSGKPVKKKSTRVDLQTQKYFDEAISCLSELNIELCDESGRRQTDAVLWKDVRLAFETLCHMASTEAEIQEFPPFRNGRPAPDNHPARECLFFAFRAVLLIETFGEDWKGTYLGDRRGFVDAMEKDLRSTIRYGWAATDREARLNQPSAVFVSEEDADDAPTSSAEASVKSLPRLSLLLERVCLARMLIGLYVSRNEMTAAVDVIRDYLLSTIPCWGKEEKLYPRLPPVLSFVVLEGMVRPCLSEMGWNQAQNGGTEVELWSHLWGDAKADESTGKIYLTCIHHTASIWKIRATSSHDRIRHVARVELAAYRRLCEECGVSENAISWDKNRLNGLREGAESTLDRKEQRAAYQLCLVYEGSLVLSNLIWSPERSRDWNLHRLDCWCAALRQIYLRGYEEGARNVGKKVTLNTPPDPVLEECREQFTYLWELNPFESSLDKVHVLSMLMKGAAALADGDAVIRYGGELIDILQNMSPGEHTRQNFRSVWDVFRNVTKRPMVRIINLQRRHDRWKHMVCQAMSEEFLIVRGLGDMKASDDSDGINWTFGGFALDGQWPRTRLLETLRAPAHFSKLLDKHWRPIDLAAFDRDAPRLEKSVSMHDSEIACALSHIACWKACGRTFPLADPTLSTVSTSGLLRQADSLRRSLQLAGYARGSPLSNNHSGMPPTPVCLVLEDDAHVVDDFCAALEKLLANLPRDFHYCALGYSRPRAAPILIPWSSRPQIGIPTHLFFATGYLLSPAGVTYLQEHSPVQGPVDAWLGRLMTRNFDNDLGVRLGVGTHGKGGAVSASQAAGVMTFRAFCSVPTLCSQPLRNKKTSKKDHQRWKDKDTDITYSGHP